MTTYNAILATETDPDAPLRSSLFKRLVANPIAAFEGDSTAVAAGVTLRLGAIQRLGAGAFVRLTKSAFIQTNASGSVTAGVTLGFVQAGTIRANVSNAGTLNVRTNQITRTRAGTTATIVAATSSTINADISVFPGDLFTFSSTGAWSGGTQNITSTIVLSTNGADLWPGEGMFGYISGNTIY